MAINTTQTQIPLTDAQKKECLKQLAAKKERDYELVTGIVENRENPGQEVVFMFKKYAGDFKGYSFYDGEKVEVPRMIAEHLNNGCFYYEYEHLDTPTGKSPIRAAAHQGTLDSQNYKVKRKIYRYAFKPLMFTDDDFDMHQSRLVEAIKK